MYQKSCQNGAKMVQNGAKMQQRGAQMPSQWPPDGPRGLKMATRGTKMATRRLQEAPGRSQEVKKVPKPMKIDSEMYKSMMVFCDFCSYIFKCGLENMDPLKLQKTIRRRQYMHQLRENGNLGFPVPLASTGVRGGRGSLS